MILKERIKKVTMITSAPFLRKVTFEVMKLLMNRNSPLPNPTDPRMKKNSCDILIFSIESFN